MGRKAQIIGQIVDVHGEMWDVRETRETTHGWRLYIGWPHSVERGRGGRGPGTVPTQPLIEYLSTTRAKDVILPVSRGVITRLRAEHDINWDWSAWWGERKGDLFALTLEAFCDKHGCSMGAASQRRTEMSGNVQQQQKFTDQELAKVIDMSRQTADVAAELGCDYGRVWSKRKKLGLV